MENVLNNEQPDIRPVAPPSLRVTVIWIAALSALPAITALFSFEPDGEFAVWQLFARQFWLPSQLFEIITIIFAFASGCSVRTELASFSRPVRALAMLWFASLLLATALASQPDTAVLSLISWTIHALFAVSIWFLIRNWKQRETGSWSSQFVRLLPLGSVAFILLIGMFVAIIGIGNKFDWVSSLPGFTHIRHSGYFLMPVLALSTGLIATSSGRSLLAPIALLALNFGFAIWIGSRGPLTIYCAMLFIAVLLFPMMRHLRTLGAIILALAVGTLLSQAIPTPSHSSFNAISRMEGGQSQSVDKLSSGRTEIWRDTLQAILKQPLIGHGGNQFRLQVPAARETYNHPHNSVLQFTYEWGLIGGGTMLCLLAMLGWKILRATLANPADNIALFLAAMSMALFSLIDGVFYYNLPIMIFLTCAFGALAQRELTPGK